MTICSQGWVPEVVDKVLERQFEDYLQSQNTSTNALNQVQTDRYRSNYIDKMYPGSKLPPKKIISQLISQNPEVTLSSEVLVDKGYNECENTEGDNKQDDLKCPNGPGVLWDEFKIDKDGNKKMLCLNADVNHGRMTTGGSSFQENECKRDPYLPQCCKDCVPEIKGNTCTYFGANRLRFSLEDSGLQEKLFELYCDWSKRHETHPSPCK